MTDASRTESWLDDARLSGQVAFIAEIDRLKGVLRHTLTLDGARRENSAEHSWHISMFAMLMHEYTPEPRPDLARVIQLLLLHDIVEIDAGDTFAYDTAGYADKEEREQAAARRLFGLLPTGQRDRWTALWREFEEGVTPEAQYANAVDRLLPLVQNYYSGGVSWVRNGITHSQVVRRIAPVAATSPVMWSFALELLDRAVDRGLLRDDRSH
ncbi:HD domain-containing protein [Deinococcus peraridilitoris]|uniref:Putative HD superfamily hydrolase n=1 Tax=Deinococcus peraridilitoris (strain DSM 19664 / LMG 22246 / CIP 109416 / KR-200) TaxID=937777 RepID=L0A1M7_DEIPD|nr:HD domain-containing protein [Deinococcus peraridilitoris]AFZ67354.1 putative HD superfamily hydrolase [Deinococcus peraridilitoris DSM 19664]